MVHVYSFQVQQGRGLRSRGVTRKIQLMQHDRSLSEARRRVLGVRSRPVGALLLHQRQQNPVRQRREAGHCGSSHQNQQEQPSPAALSSVSRTDSTVRFEPAYPKSHAADFVPIQLFFFGTILFIRFEGSRDCFLWSGCSCHGRGLSLKVILIW